MPRGTRRHKALGEVRNLPRSGKFLFLIMQIRIFTISVFDTGAGIAELNRYLAGQRVLEVEQKMIQTETGAFWTFCIRSVVETSVFSGNRAVKEKVDYKQVLNETEFAIFSDLRTCRKKIAQDDSVPAYAVFTDEELCGIVRLENISTEQLKKVPGIGEKKIEKYGELLLNCYFTNKKQP